MRTFALALLVTACTPPAANEPCEPHGTTTCADAATLLECTRERWVAYPCATDCAPGLDGTRCTPTQVSDGAPCPTYQANRALCDGTTRLICDGGRNLWVATRCTRCEVNNNRVDCWQ